MKLKVKMSGTAPDVMNSIRPSFKNVADMIGNAPRQGNMPIKKKIKLKVK